MTYAALYSILVKSTGVWRDLDASSLLSHGSAFGSDTRPATFMSSAIEPRSCHQLIS